MKSLMSLWRVLATDVARRCGTSAHRDIQTVAMRVRDEGESFLTITLPLFEKDFVRSLELGRIDSANLFKNFEKRGGLPAFLSGYTSQIFHSDGTLLDTPSVDCIDAVRQLTLVFGKIERPCSDARVARAMRRYVEVEEELKNMDTSRFEEFLPRFQQAAMFLFADVFADVERDLLGRSQLVQSWPEYDLFGRTTPASTDPFLGLVDFVLPHSLKKAIGKVVDPPCGIGVRDEQWLVPRHGPGATADRLRGNAKYDLVVWPQRLERVFPYGDYALPMLSQHDKLDRVQFLEPGKETPVKVVAVPKTLKTPRIIAEEPTAMQYMQQALSQQLVNRLEDLSESRMVRNSPVNEAEKLLDLGKYFIGFVHQEPNRFLAREGSLHGYLATLDLSEASDRVLNQHVRLLFSRFPRLNEAIQATRSLKADVRGHGVIPLTKFASMGSALCFPVEAMVFTAIIFAAISYERRVPLTRGFLLRLRGQVRVYGDDIIVPVDCVPRVIQFLEAFGLVVNKDKSFWNGKFRESCGGDYYDGEWVTPVRLRKDLPSSLDDVSSVVGLVSFRNLLYWRGYWTTAAAIDNRLESLFRGNYPIVDVTAEGLGRESVFAYRQLGIHPKTHTPLTRGARVVSTTPQSPITGDGALMKFLIKRGVLPSQDEKHLERQGRPYTSRIKIGWIRPY